MIDPLLGAASAADTLTSLFLVLLAAKLGDELFKRIKQPAVVGEILAGLLIGPSVLGLAEPDEVLEVFAELGVVFLLFWVGLETRISDLREVGRLAALVGILGVLIPFAGGLGLGFAIGEVRTPPCSSPRRWWRPASASRRRCSSSSGVLGGRAAPTILGAAVVDDVLAMLVLAVAVGIAGAEGSDAPQGGKSSRA